MAETWPSWPGQRQKVLSISAVCLTFSLAVVGGLWWDKAQDKTYHAGRSMMARRRLGFQLIQPSLCYSTSVPQLITRTGTDTLTQIYSHETHTHTQTHTRTSQETSQWSPRTCSVHVMWVCLCFCLHVSTCMELKVEGYLYQSSQEDQGIRGSAPHIHTLSLSLSLTHTHTHKQKTQIWENTQIRITQNKKKN